MEEKPKRLEGCNKFLYQSEESNYPQCCDGFATCDGSYRLCKDCKIKYNLSSK